MKQKEKQEGLNLILYRLTQEDQIFRLTSILQNACGASKRKA